MLAHRARATWMILKLMTGAIHTPQEKCKTIWAFRTVEWKLGSDSTQREPNANGLKCPFCSSLLLHLRFLRNDLERQEQAVAGTAGQAADLSSTPTSKSYPAWAPTVIPKPRITNNSAKKTPARLRKRKLYVENVSAAGPR